MRRPPLLAIESRNGQSFGPVGVEVFTTDFPDARVVLLDGSHFLLESHLDKVAEQVHAALDAMVGAKAGA